MGKKNPKTDERAPWWPPPIDMEDATAFIPNIVSRPYTYFPDSPRIDVAQPAQAPYGAIALVNAYAGGQAVELGTAFWVAPDVLLTAGHVISNPGYNDLFLWPGFNQQTNQSATVRATSWVRHSALDLGVIIAQHPAGMAMSRGKLPGSVFGVRIAGYSYVGGNYVRLSEALGPAKIGVGGQLFYHASSEQGDSGAPVLMATTREVIAINTDGAITADGNRGLLLTDPVVQQAMAMAQFARTHFPPAKASP